jgi:hypothetical protein
MNSEQLPLSVCIGLSSDFGELSRAVAKNLLFVFLGVMATWRLSMACEL